MVVAPLAVVAVVVALVAMVAAALLSPVHPLLQTITRDCNKHSQQQPL
jgi:hypothetical protein